MIGVDLGGTNVRAQALYEDGSEAGQRFENPSWAQTGTERILDAVSLTIRQAISSSEGLVHAVGLAIPGHVDDDSGLVKWAPNFGETIDGVFHYWENVPFKTDLEARIGLPIVMGNDANAAALGEYKFGSGRNQANCLVMLTLGTGIGGGVVLGRRSVMGKSQGPLLLVGGNQGGVELGHTIVMHRGVDSTAGAYGSIEAYCQRDAIIRRCCHRLRRGRVSLINDLVEGDWSHITPKTISDAAEKGDELAIEVWREFGEWLGAGIGSLINVFAPDVFALGGQISKASEWFLPYALTEARNVAIPSLFVDAKIVLAEKIEDAGLLGGAALALEAHPGL